jgi:hypothetical protein
VWYNQAINNHARQTTANQQAKLVDNGILVTFNGLPTLDFGEDQGTLIHYSLDSEVVSNTVLAVVKVRKYAFLSYLLFNDVVSEGFYLGGRFLRPDSGIGLFFEGTTYTLTGETLNQQLIYFNHNGSGYNIARDGNSETFFSGPSELTINTISRGDENLEATSFVSEIVIFNDNQSSLRNIIETNINNYYAIY